LSGRFNIFGVSPIGETYNIVKQNGSQERPYPGFGGKRSCIRNVALRWGLSEQLLGKVEAEESAFRGEIDFELVGS
jgi:hypothetical protein